MLKEKYHFEDEEARRIGDFLSPMLDLVPERRANAGGMADWEWLRDARGMEGVRVEGVEAGTRGEGIDGWFMEIKKR